MPVIPGNGDRLIDFLVGKIQILHAKYGIPRGSLDKSGGIDSAVLAGLLALALGPDKVTFQFLGINSNPAAYKRAKGLIEAIGGRLSNFDGTEIFRLTVEGGIEALVAAGYDRDEIMARVAKDPTIFGGIRSTLRAPWGRMFNRLTGGGIRHGTGNEDEDRWLRFFQKGGDGEVDTNPISMLSKGEVYQLARALGRRLNAVDAYEAIIQATPSADLWGNGDAHNDESEIGNYLGVKGYPYYSYIDENDQYRTVGLIERVSRFLDQPARLAGGRINGDILFSDDAREETLASLIEMAPSAPEFVGIAPEDVKTLLRNARRIEYVTRHKMNPNCPALTLRTELLEAGIVTNDLPV